MARRHFLNNTATIATAYLFLMNFTYAWEDSVRCGEDFTEKAGAIKSPNYPDPYPAFSDCMWKIKAPTGYRISIHSTALRMEGGGCDFDYLKITDSGYAQDSQKQSSEVFCGQKSVDYQSLTNEVTLHFISDATESYYGFNLYYTFKHASMLKSAMDYCNMTNINTPGFLSSPGYPKPYGGHTDCFYHLKAPSDQKIQLEFLVFDLQYNTKCRFNYLQVFDGPDMTYPHSERFCGKQDIGFYYSHGSELLIRFVSTSSYYTGAGFNVHFTAHTSFTMDDSNRSGSDDIIEPTAECKKIIERKGVKLHSPGYPEVYPSNTQCTYIIRSPPEETVTLTFHKFKLEDDPDCRYDYVKIKDGESAAADVLDKLCGTHNNKTYTSTGRSLRLDFISDAEVSYMGFSASYTFSNCPKRCRNGGTCFNNRCKCPHGFTGPQCEYHESCSDRPCLNNATCSERRVGYKCYCTDGYTGYNCEKKKYVVKLVGQARVERLTNVEFKCLLNGEKARNVNWFFNGDKLKGQRSGRVQTDENVLYIHKATEEDEGEYMCAVFIKKTAYYNIKQLVVNARCNLHVGKAVNQTASANQKTRLFCPIKVYQGSSVIWKKNGYPLKLGKRKSASGRTVKFRNVIAVDAGKYTCIAVGPTGCSAKADVWLTYQGRELPQECGHNSFNHHDHSILAKIQSGHPAAFGSAPWFVNFVKVADKKSFCGGTLISRNHIVTAAHCISVFPGVFNNTNVHIYLGTQNCSGVGGLQVQMKSITLHPSFNKSSVFDSDIAIVEFYEKLHFSKNIRPLCLVDKAVIEEVAFYSGVYGTVVGCGLTSNGIYPSYLNEVKVPYVSNENCRTTLQSGHNLTENMFCAGSRQAHRGDSCYGDSGGPYAVQSPSSNRWMLVGIVSWGYKCDQRDAYGFYTNVGQFYDWIMSVISKT